MNHTFLPNNKIIGHIGIIIIFWILSRIIIHVIINYSDIFMGDSGYYISSGKSIVDKLPHFFSSELVIQDTFRPPLYSIFTGLLISISESPLFIFIFHSIIHLLFSIFCYIALNKECEKISLLSAIAVAVSPFDAIYNTSLLSENIVTPLLVSSSLLFVFFKSNKSFFLSGMIIGLVVLTKDIYILLPFAFTLIGLIHKKFSTKYLFIYLFGFLIVVMPWMLRNAYLSDNNEAYVSKGIMWPNIWVGTWIRDHKDTIDASINKVPEKALNTLNPKLSKEDFFKIWVNRIDNGAFFKDATVTYLLNNPLDVLDAWVSRYYLLWVGTRSDLSSFNYERYGTEWYAIKYLFYFINTLIIILSLLGIYLAMIFKNRILLLCIPVIYSAIIFIPLYNIETRYTQPVYPILLIFTVFFILRPLHKSTQIITPIQ